MLSPLNFAQSMNNRAKHNIGKTAQINFQRFSNPADHLFDGLDKSEGEKRLDKELKISDYFQYTDKLHETSNGLSWDSTDRFTYTYNTDGTLAEESFKVYENSMWLNSYRSLFTYDAEGYEILQLDQTGDVLAWQNAGRIIYTRNNNHSIDNFVGQVWENNDWINNFKRSFSYTYLGDDSIALNQVWNGNNWLNHFQDLYFYENGTGSYSVITQNGNDTNWVNAFQFFHDSSGNEVNDWYQQWDGTAWVNRSSIRYTYDMNGNKTTTAFQNWNGTSWQNTKRYIYSYDGNRNEIESLYQIADGAGWQTNYRHIYTYDVNNNIKREVEQSWNGSQWVNELSYVYEYDSNGYLYRQTFQSPNGSDSWYNMERWTYSYANSNIVIATSVNDENTINKFKLFNNYPNPFNPSTKISWRSPVAGHQTLKIYDVLGNEVATLIDEYSPAGNYEVTFDASKLSSGIYFYKLQAGNFVETKKLVLLK